MEVRCGKCNKLFRVADDKIKGTGIKFPCTRCGESVMITREDFEKYTFSRNAVPVPDLFEQKTKQTEAALWPETETAPLEHASRSFDLAPHAAHEDTLEAKAPSFTEPDVLASSPALKSKPAAAIELELESLGLTEAKTKPHVESQSEQRPEQKPGSLSVPQQQAKPTTERETPPAPSIQPDVPKKEYAHHDAPPVSPAADSLTTGPVHSSRPSRSGRTLLVLFVVLIIAGLSAYGIFYYLQYPPPSLQKGKKAVKEMISIEGLQIISPVGSMETNGDLLISGAIENAAEKERALWYVLAIVNDAQGSELANIRLLNGKQIYTRRDYDILAGRGVNVQELKTKKLQEKGVVIPPKGTAKFEIRYFQPPPGVASFHVQVLPFDPVQLNKEIAAVSN